MPLNIFAVSVPDTPQPCRWQARLLVDVLHIGRRENIFGIEHESQNYNALQAAGRQRAIGGGGDAVAAALAGALPKRGRELCNPLCILRAAAFIKLRKRKQVVIGRINNSKNRRRPGVVRSNGAIIKGR